VPSAGSGNCPEALPLEALLRTFFEGRDPTQGLRPGNDVGTQYRSGLYTNGPAQEATARAMRETYAQALRVRGFRDITTEIKPLEPFYFAEGDDQQHLAKTPGGYSGLGGTGVSCPVGTGVVA